MIDEIREELDADAQTQSLIPGSFLMTNKSFQKFEQKIQRSIIWLLRYLQVIQNWAVCRVPHYEQSSGADEDAACLQEYNSIVNAPADDSFTTRTSTRNIPAAN